MFLMDYHASLCTPNLSRPESVEGNGTLFGVSQKCHVLVQWIYGLLGMSIKSSLSTKPENGTGWGLAEREWKKELSSIFDRSLFRRISLFTDTVHEFAEPGRADLKRWKERFVHRSTRLRYQLPYRLPRGSGSEDSIEVILAQCQGSMEMGSRSAFDRCINSLWDLALSHARGCREMTRGHGELSEVVISIGK
jgi:hypothetical protein